MSAFGGKADIGWTRDVRFVPKAEVAGSPSADS